MKIKMVRYPARIEGKGFKIKNWVRSDFLGTYCTGEDSNFEHRIALINPRTLLAIYIGDCNHENSTPT